MEQHDSLCEQYMAFYRGACLCMARKIKAENDLPEWERVLLNPKVANVPIPTSTIGKIKVEFLHDPESDDFPGAAAAADMIRVETPQGYIEVTVCNGATHVMISEARFGETKAEMLLSQNGTFQKIG